MQTYNNDAVQNYKNFFLKLAGDGKETFNDEPSNKKTEKDDEKDKATEDAQKGSPIEKGVDPNAQIGVAQDPQPQMQPEPMQNMLMTVLGPEIIMAASQGDPNAQHVLAMTAAEVVKAMMGIPSQGMMGMPMQQQYQQSPEQYAASQIVPPIGQQQQQMMPQQAPQQMYNQAMQ